MLGPIKTHLEEYDLVEEQQRRAMVGCSETTDNLVTLGRTRKLMKLIPPLCYNGDNELSIMGSGGTGCTQKLKKKRNRKTQRKKENRRKEGRKDTTALLSAMEG